MTPRENCPNVEFFLVHIFLYSDWIQRFTPQISVFCLNTGKCGREEIPYLDTFCVVWSIYMRNEKWYKTFKSGLSKFCGRQPLNNFKGYGLIKRAISLQMKIWNEKWSIINKLLIKYTSRRVIEFLLRDFVF